MDGEAFASLLICLPMATSNIIRNDAGRARGRIVQPANPSAPQVGALNHGCRRDWEAGVSGQENVLCLFCPETQEFALARAGASAGAWSRRSRD
jgi:hypothetical protein